MPLYYQIESLLRSELSTGRYPAGIPLPTEEALIRRFGVSRITVRRALERLVQEDLIYRVPGRGTFVNTARSVEFRIERNPADLMGFEADIRRGGFTPAARVLRAEWIPTPSDVAEALGLEPDAEVLWLRRLGTASGQPLWIEDRYIVRTWAAQLRPRDYATPSILASLARARGFSVDHARVRIAARAAGRDEARLLGVRHGAPVLVAEFAVSAGGRPAQLVRARFRPERYAFAFTVEAQGPVRSAASTGEGIRDRS
ncbi:MAG: GntR family transcriptional regulator [Armatimonadota bacterium]|nr:GntR family transcriptional regulator [Armatimonadota bacterium]